MSIKFEGLDEILNSMDNLVDTTNLEQAIGVACALVERTAKEGTPKGTGALRRSIKSRVENSNGDIVGIVFTPLEYAPYVEFGTGKFAENGNGRKDVPWYYKDDEGKWHITSGMKPHPYMRPALCNNKEKIKNLIKEALTND